MKTKLVISLVMALLLVALMPATVLAAKPVPFTASGAATYIELGGSVFPAGDSGRWVVTSRYLKGYLASGIPGTFTLTYKANVDSMQAGNLHGTLKMDDGSYTFNVNAKVQPLEVVWFEPYQTYLPKLTMGGHWNFLDGAKGEGKFGAWLIFIPQGEHVGSVVASGFDVTGQWQP